MSRRVLIAGSGMTPFVKPSQSPPYTELAASAIRIALHDASIDYSQIQQAYAGYVYGDSTAGQAVIYPIGMTGIPVFNVNNNCSTGSTALFLARQAIEAGAIDCALVIGFEQMVNGALAAVYSDRPNPLAPWVQQSRKLQPAAAGTPPAAHLFGGAGNEYQARYGVRSETFARIAVKAREHARHNDKAIFRDPLTVEQVLTTPEVFGVLTRAQCCPPTCGAAAAVLVSESYARQRGLDATVEIRAQALTTDTPATFESDSMIKAIGFDMTAEAARQVYEHAGLGPEDIDVCELHDCFTSNALISYDALGFADPGNVERFVMERENTYGGRIVTNPSGGLLAKGHPLGATGVAQCCELVDQLRGRCGYRQVPDARIALQHNIGIGGACVVTLYARA